MKKILIFFILLSITPWFLTKQFKIGITPVMSTDYLFYSGTGEHGTFLLSFLPLILIGLYQLWLFKKLFFLLLLFIMPLPVLSVIATLGFVRLSNNKPFFIANIIGIFYEGLRLYHILLVHKV